VYAPLGLSPLAMLKCAPLGQRQIHILNSHHVPALAYYSYDERLFPVEFEHLFMCTFKTISPINKVALNNC